MPSELKELDRVFYCLSNATRRDVIERLSVAPASMSELAEPFDMALPSFLQHLRILEDAGLITSQKDGRVRTFRLNPPPCQLAKGWLDAQRQKWNGRLDQLEDVLNQLQEDQNHEQPRKSSS